MARVTSKLQVTVPKIVAEKCGIAPGDEIDWIPAGDGIRVVKRGSRRQKSDVDSGKMRLRLFDETTDRQRKRNLDLRAVYGTGGPADGRGWTREDLYSRGRSD